jgi:hypothetical protein
MVHTTETRGVSLPQRGYGFTHRQNFPHIRHCSRWRRLTLRLHEGAVEKSLQRRSLPSPRKRAGRSPRGRTHILLRMLRSPKQQPSCWTSLFEHSRIYPIQRSVTHRSDEKAKHVKYQQLQKISFRGISLQSESEVFLFCRFRFCFSGCSKRIDHA